MKCLVRDKEGRVLVVKETGRNWWDLPGGGMDHGEDIAATIAREMHEEVTMTGDFTHTILTVDEPKLLDAHNFWQIRLVFAVQPKNMQFKPGDDGDELTFIDPIVLKDSTNPSERFVYHCSTIK